MTASEQEPGCNGNAIARTQTVKPPQIPRRVAKTFANLGVAMAEIDFPPMHDFFYRHNQDGSVDSICMKCFLTAATAMTMKELARQESLHESQCVGKICPDLVKPDEQDPANDG